MKATTVLDILRVVSWVIFIGLFIKTGGMIISLFVSLFIDAQAARGIYLGLFLPGLMDYNIWHYIVLAVFIIAISGLKAYLFYWVIKIISKINFTNPFSEYNGKIIFKMSSIALQIGILSVTVQSYVLWLSKNHVLIPYRGDSNDFLYLAGILFVIGFIFKRGIELQSENELTV